VAIILAGLFGVFLLLCVAKEIGWFDASHEEIAAQMAEFDASHQDHQEALDMVYELIADGVLESVSSKKAGQKQIIVGPAWSSWTFEAKRGAADAVGRAYLRHEDETTTVQFLDRMTGRVLCVYSRAGGLRNVSDR